MAHPTYFSLKTPLPAPLPQVTPGEPFSKPWGCCEGAGGPPQPRPQLCGDFVRCVTAAPLPSAASVNSVCLFCLFFFSQLHLSSPPRGCSEQEAQLRTASKFRPILRCGLHLTSSLAFFPPDHPGSLLFTRKQTSCLAARGPEPPETLSRPPGLRTAHPSRKRSLTAAAFLRKLTAERPSGAGTLIVAAFPPAADDFAHTTAGERCHPGDVSPPWAPNAARVPPRHAGGTGWVRGLGAGGV